MKNKLAKSVLVLFFFAVLFSGFFYFIKPISSGLYCQKRKFTIKDAVKRSIIDAGYKSPEAEDKYLEQMLNMDLEKCLNEESK